MRSRGSWPMPRKSRCTSTSDLYIGTGVVGGVMRGTRETGTHIGDMALRVLAGTRPQDIPIETVRVMPVIDWRQVLRWRIDPSRLPPDRESSIESSRCGSVTDSTLSAP